MRETEKVKRRRGVERDKVLWIERDGGRRKERSREREEHREWHGRGRQREFPCISIK